MIAAALLLLLAQGSVDLWMDDLSSEHPAVRANAVERLMELGEDAAVALEQRDFPNPEARVLALELLRVLRHPRCVLHAPRYVGATRSLVHLELSISNLRPEPVRIEPFSISVKNRLVQNERWHVELPSGIGGVLANHKLLRKGVTVPARGDAVYTIPVAMRLTGRTGFAVRVRYDGPDFELEARAKVRVGRESLANLRRRAYSSREEDRAIAVFALKSELLRRRKDREFQRLLRLVARSPFRDVRLGIAEALSRNGLRGERFQIRVACSLAADRDLAVARAAHAALGRLLPPRMAMPEVQRLASKAFARPGDARSRMMAGLLDRWQGAERALFFANVLEGSRSRRVHERVASLLRKDGYPVEPGAGGLVPRSQIRSLRR